MDHSCRSQDGCAALCTRLGKGQAEPSQPPPPRPAILFVGCCALAGRPTRLPPAPQRCSVAPRSESVPLSGGSEGQLAPLAPDEGGQLQSAREGPVLSACTRKSPRHAVCGSSSCWHPLASAECARGPGWKRGGRTEAQGAVGLESSLSSAVHAPRQQPGVRLRGRCGDSALHLVVPGLGTLQKPQLCVTSGAWRICRKVRVSLTPVSTRCRSDFQHGSWRL